ncbi:serine/threonine protein kinase [Persicimonas caeni]|nr:serine/threonine-protein kinase [Persicimonas caeni]
MATTSDNPSGGDGGYLGRILDERYRLDEVIGAGAIGKVYAGTQLAVDRTVAIKLLHPAIRDRELSKERFLREAKAVARMNHSSCLTLFDFGSDDELGCFYMVTEFVEGRTLADEMRDGRLSLEQIFHVLYQVTTALQHAHERGILHRDLKPENIMLVAGDGGYSSVKVLDFGLARIREEAAPSEGGEKGNAGSVDDSRLTNFGEINGTPAYMSPEQCRGDLNLTPACDYYSLGVLAYELIEGRLPYESSVVQRLLSMHMNDPIPEMKSGRAPDEVEAMVYRMLAKKPAHRLQSADEILEILRPYVALEPSQEFSMASLDRYKRDASASQDALETKTAPVAQSGEQTLVNYDQADTPLPQAQLPIEDRKTLALDSDERASHDSAFGTMLAADAASAAASEDGDSTEAADGPGRAGVVALAVGFVVAAVAGVLWFADTTPSEPAKAEPQEQVDRARPATPSEDDEPSLTATDESSQASDGVKAAAEEEGDDKQEAEADEAKTTIAADKPGRAKQAEERGKPRPTPRPDDKKKRPRKLELTY